MNDKPTIEPIDMLMLNDWKTMDTSGAAILSDKHLLAVVSQSRVSTGWGNIAELMKRYEKLSNEP